MILYYFFVFFRYKSLQECKTFHNLLTLMQLRLPNVVISGITLMNSVLRCYSLQVLKQRQGRVSPCLLCCKTIGSIMLGQQHQVKITVYVNDKEKGTLSNAHRPQLDKVKVHTSGKHWCKDEVILRDLMFIPLGPADTLPTKVLKLCCQMEVNIWSLQ